MIDKTDERICEAELYRLKGELLLVQCPERQPAPEAAFQTALSIARRQRAQSWELRAATRLGTTCVPVRSLTRKRVKICGRIRVYVIASGRFELYQRPFRRDIVKHRDHRHVDLQVRMIALDHVRDHPRSFIELNDGIDMRRIVAEGRMHRLIDDGEAIEPAAAANGCPDDVAG
jgi:hypothetical protein